MQITDTVVFDDHALEERFVRASGPGGQNINKVATAVELRVDIVRSGLPPDVQQRLVALAGRRVTTDGVLMIVSRVYRSQTQNRAAALARLIALLGRAATLPKKRTATRPRAGVRANRLRSKKFRSARKRARRPRAVGER